jgi:phage-related protein
VQGHNVIDQWRSTLSPEGQAKMTAALKNVAKIENQLEWGARDLEGAPKKEKILELKFIADKKQYRIAFIFQPGYRVVLLAGFYHKQKVYTPPNAIETARKRAGDYRANRATSIERKIRFDL